MHRLSLLDGFILFVKVHLISIGGVSGSAVVDTVPSSLLPHPFLMANVYSSVLHIPSTKEDLGRNWFCKQMRY